MSGHTDVRETVTLDRDVYLGVLWLLASHVLTGLRDQWLGWWILTPLAASAQTMAIVCFVVYAFRGRWRKGG